jgi:Amt family ammonium transporter
VISSTSPSEASEASHPWVPRVSLRWCLLFISACSPLSRTSFRFQGLDPISRLTRIPLSLVLATGGVAERGRLGPTMVFTFVWGTLVYCPLACMTWNAKGWSAANGGLDFAGGTPVHISSGTAALAISIYLGKRTGYGTEKLAYKPHNTTYVILGTVFLWFGWFGFNGGSALAANLRAAQACVITNLAASVGGLTWMLWDYRLERKWSAVGFCSGAISGLVAITPASGFVGSRE